MIKVDELAFPYQVLLSGGSAHWKCVRAESTEPMTLRGLSAFVRYRDAVAARYAYVVTRWGAISRNGLLEGEALVYSVSANASSRMPRSHPSNDHRFQQLAELRIRSLPDGVLPPIDDPAADPSSCPPLTSGLIPELQEPIRDELDRRRPSCRACRGSTS